MISTTLLYSFSQVDLLYERTTSQIFNSSIDLLHHSIRTGVQAKKQDDGVTGVLLSFPTDTIVTLQ